MAFFRAFLPLLPFLPHWPTFAAADGGGPWIGILGIPAHIECDSLPAFDLGSSYPQGASCFTNVYDKWVQAAGARAVGIPYDALDTNSSALDDLLNSIDGVIFTGGGLSLFDTKAPYYRTGNYIFEWAKSRNDNGLHFPLRAHCMGFQFLAILAARGNSSVLVSNMFDSEDLSLPLEWTPAAAASRWVQRMPSDVRKTFTEENSTTNLHHDGVTPVTFGTNPLLPEFFDVLSTNHDRKGHEFLSTIEAKKYPIVATQWHPERNQFEWKPKLNINHSMHAVEANAWTARDFIGEALLHVEASRNIARVRNWALLRKMTTFAMQEVPAADTLTGLSYLLFEGFGNASSPLAPRASSRSANERSLLV